MPAPKKHPSTRARGNRASTAAVLTGDKTAGLVRPLPPIRVWADLTQEWWRDLWASPMSSEYHSSDWYQLIPLAIAYNLLVTDEDLSPNAFKALSEEVRAHRTPFGMTPYDRRRLEWTIEQAEDAKDSGKARRERQGNVQPKTGSDPRAVLSIVS